MNGFSNDSIILAKQIKKRDEERQRNITEWISFFRENPHRFATHYLGIKQLTVWQQINLYLMFHNSNFVWIASRGLGKTFLSVLFSLIKCILYPGTHIVFTSMALKQVVKIISQKLTDFRNNYPNIDCEIKDASLGSENPRIEFYNGSVIWLAPPSENALGFRAQVIIVDEYRKVKDDIIKTVFVKFLTKTRTLPFKLIQDSNGNYKYQDYPEEANTQIYISSQSPTFEPGYKRYVNAINSMARLKGFMSICEPYYLGIPQIINKQQIMDELKQDGADLAVFMLEYECIPFGANSNAFFTTEMFRMNRRINKIFIPMRGEEYLAAKRDKSKNPFYIAKEKGEKRIVAVDTASTQSKSSANTILHCIRLLPRYDKDKNGYYEKQVVYIKNISDDMHHTSQAKVIRRIFYQFEADTLVIDGQGNSLGVMQQLFLPCYDEEYDESYPAFISFNDDKINAECREPFDECNPVVFSVKIAGSTAQELQHQYNTYTRSELVSRHIKFPVEESDGVEYLNRYHKYDEQSAEIQAEWVSVFKQCDALIIEAVNLEKKPVEGSNLVILKMPKKSTIKRRDRIIALQYGMLYARQLEIEDFKYEKKYDYSGFKKLSSSFSRSKSLNPFSSNFNRVEGFGWRK